jgi:predicted dithiol-disulfide oxidoreductase (DUF899 family)
MHLPQVVSPEEWRAARDELLVKEKAHMRASDALAAERRRLPMVAFDKDYEFEGPHGRLGLADLFDGRRQLVAYHFMFEPEGTPCGGCSCYVDNLGHPAHLNARDTTFVLTSRASQQEIDAYKERMGWEVPWFTVASEDFYRDVGINKAFGLSVFIRDDDDNVFRSYFTTSRGVETLGPHWTLLDLTPYGRQEEWEDSPDGVPQTPPYQWWRLHDEYVAS